MQNALNNIVWLTKYRRVVYQYPGACTVVAYVPVEETNLPLPLELPRVGS